MDGEMSGKNGLTPSLLFALSAITIGSSFVFGYNVAVMNGPAEVIKSWIQNESYPSIHETDLDHHQLVKIWSWTVSIFILSGGVGGLLCGFAADRIGRRGTMIMNDVIAILGSVILGVSKWSGYYFLLMVGRFVMGISCGVSSGLGPMYLTELAPLRLRGVLGSVNGFVIVIGYFTAQVLSMPELLGSETLWPVLVAFSAIPALIQMVSLPFCPESPKYLFIIKKKKAEAGSVLSHISKTIEIAPESNSLLDDSVKSCTPAPPASAAQTQATPYKGRMFWWAMTICLCLHLSEQVSGAPAVIYYSTIIFRENAEMEHEQAIGASLGIGATLIISSLISTIAVERMGRRFLMFIGLVGTFVSDIAIFICLHLLAIDDVTYQAASYAAVLFVYLFIFSFAIGPSSIPWFYVSELFEPSQRAKANTIATISNWCGAFLIGSAFLPMKEQMGEFVFLVFAAAVAVLFSFLFFVTPETKARHSKEIEMELERRMPACCSA